MRERSMMVMPESGPSCAMPVDPFATRLRVNSAQRGRLATASERAGIAVQGCPGKSGRQVRLVEDRHETLSSRLARACPAHPRLCCRHPKAEMGGRIPAKTKL